MAADVFVIAAGALESARLCLLSPSHELPEGLGNGSGLLGRYFMEHQRVVFRGVLDRAEVVGNGRSHQFYEDLKREEMGSAILGFASESGGGRRVLRISADIEMLPAAENRIAPTPGLRDRFGRPGLGLSLTPSARDIATVDHVRALIRRIYRDLGVLAVHEVIGDPGLGTWLYHHMGTGRMGHDPAFSVVDATLRVHESPYLYLLGSAAFVTSGASNPTLTITALAHRLGDRLSAPR